MHSTPPRMHLNGTYFLTTVFFPCTSEHQRVGTFQGRSLVNVWSREICLIAPAFVIFNARSCDVVEILPV